MRCWNKLILVMILLHPATAYSQNETFEIGESVRIANATVDGAGVPSPTFQLQAFYSMSRGLIDALQTSRISGRGWKIDQSARMKLRTEVDNCITARENFLTEANELTELTPEFWSRVVERELKSEELLAGLLEETLRPDAQAAYFIENAKELAASVFYSPLFWASAGLTKEQQVEMMLRLKQELMARTVISRGTGLAAVKRVNWLQGLSVKQLEVLLKLQARMDEGMTLEDFLDSASEREVDFFARSNDEVRKLLEARVEH